MHRVALIDDHPAIILALTSILERDPLLKVVGTAQDGTAGLALYRDLKPDLLVIDLHLPGLDGIDLIQRIRAVDTAVKILVISSFPAEQYAARCRVVGANGYVSKCLGASHILSGVKAAMAGFNCFPVEMTSDNPDDVQIARLSRREQSVLRYLAQGRTNKEIGETLSLSNKTISTHKANILTKLGLTNIIDLAAFAKAHHLL
ncbi:MULTISPECIES: response regulator transcription factor [Burkholderia]|uniref:Response regulator transcription factor n=1 Tax=Burkholderia sola TaxID=2843302 RepID=A0ABV2CDQ6_9BURK|nr:MULTISPECIES: response regulator transcription factor [unclassified Burkholderia]MBP0609296.1 response regulator transcription factor [Burkholderia sp. CpTa8-5]MBP0717760.1 response regulator transcription factor [Burkholderia sp. AcTa6-5]